MRSGIEKLNLEGSSDKEILDTARDYVSDGLTYLNSAQVKNFYARVIVGIDRKPQPGIGTMAVTVRKGKYVLMYDPIFAVKVSFEELCATLEHEVYHIILEHIPRLMQTISRAPEEDKYLYKIVSNLALDAAANALLVSTWPKMSDPEKPLGYWVLPQGFTPPLPDKLTFEVYQKLLLDLLRDRLKSDPRDLYQMASAMIKQGQKNQQGGQEQQGQQGQQNPQSQQGQQGQQNQQGQQGQAPGGQQQVQPSSAEGAAGGQNDQQQPGGQGPLSAGSGDDKYSQMSSEQLKEAADKLDPIDQEVLKMLLSSMQSHILIDTDNIQEGDAHQLAEHGRELIRSAAQAHKKSRGTVPGHLDELIQKMLMPPTVPWTQFLRNMVQRTRQTKKDRGMSRPSKIISAMHKYAQRQLNDAKEETPLLTRLRQFKRVPPFPGIKQTNRYTIVYAVDTSGSMSSADLEKGLSELQHIQKSDSEVKICVIYADTAICKEFWITPTSEIDQNLTGRGGTDFEAVFEHVAQMMTSQDKAPDILVYCTDGYAPPPVTKLPIPTVWLLTPRGRPVMADAGHITIEMKDYQLGESY